MKDVLALNLDIIYTLITTDLTTKEVSLYHSIDIDLVRSISAGQGAFNFSSDGFNYPIPKYRVHNAIVYNCFAKELNLMEISALTMERLFNVKK